MVDASIIGCGNMGGALIRGLARTEHHTITACDVDTQALESVSEYCAETTTDLSTAAESEVVILAVKPDVASTIVADLDLSASQTLVSMAAGVSTDTLKAHTDAAVVRVMPNLAAETGTMAAAVTGEAVDAVESVLADVGAVVEVDESAMDIATAVNGSGPAFVFYLLKAMKEAGEESGLDPDDAETLAAQTFKGAAETVLQSEESLEELIEAVCSPKGTTIEGMKVLRESDVDRTIGEAVAAAEQRSRALSQETDGA